MPPHAAGEELLEKPGRHAPTEQLQRVTQPLSQGEQRRRTATAEQAPARQAKSASMQRPSSSPPRPAGKEQHHQRSLTTTLPHLHGRPRVAEWLKKLAHRDWLQQRLLGRPPAARKTSSSSRGARRGATREASQCCAKHRWRYALPQEARAQPPEGETRAAAGATRSADLIGGAQLSVVGAREDLDEIQPLPSEPIWGLRRPPDGKKPNTGRS
jgi:hypothetical protein